MNVELLPEALKAEEIVVVGRAPTVDVGSTTTGVNVSSDFIRNIAVVAPGARGGAARSFESLATIAPGAQADQFGVSISGTTSPENQYVIDGLSVNDPGFGLNATPLTVDFVQEVNIITGGYMPEYGRATGGIMNVVTKSGSNEFHGSVFGNWTPGALEGEKNVVRRQGSTIVTGEKLWNLGDFGVEFGGPILKDRLWFYAGFAPSLTRNRLERKLASVRPCTSTSEFCNEARTVEQDECGFNQTDAINNSTTNYFADQRTYQYIGKLTYLINQDHNLTMSVYGTPTSSGGANSFGIDPQTAPPRSARPRAPTASSTVRSRPWRTAATRTPPTCPPSWPPASRTSASCSTPPSAGTTRRAVSSRSTAARWVATTVWRAPRRSSGGVPGFTPSAISRRSAPRLRRPATRRGPPA